MMNARALVPGIHTLGKTMVWEGKTNREITICEAQSIAEKVCDIPNILDEMSAIRSEIERVTAIPARLLAN